MVFDLKCHGSITNVTNVVTFHQKCSGGGPRKRLANLDGSCSEPFLPLPRKGWRTSIAHAGMGTPDLVCDLICDDFSNDSYEMM